MIKKVLYIEKKRSLENQKTFINENGKISTN